MTFYEDSGSHNPKRMAALVSCESRQGTEWDLAGLPKAVHLVDRHREAAGDPGVASERRSHVADKGRETRHALNHSLALPVGVVPEICHSSITHCFRSACF